MKHRLTVISPWQIPKRIVDSLYQSKMSESGSMMNLTPIEYITSANEYHKKGREYIPGQCSGKWSDLEHMKYIAFIDFNKEIMKSKQKRRSNKFYQEMADFVQTRNALQCRSHHQKLEEKYVLPIKIVSVFKQIFDQTVYREIIQNLAFNKKEKLQQKKQVKIEESEISIKNISTQTEIGGLDIEMLPLNESQVLIQPSSYHHYLPNPYGYYPTFINNHSSRLFPPCMLLNTPYGWNQAVFAYGFESSRKQ